MGRSGDADRCTTAQTDVLINGWLNALKKLIWVDRDVFQAMKQAF